MKQIFLFLIAMIIGIPCFCQITIMDDVPQEEEVLSVYDSLSNFQHQQYKKGYDYHHLIGQTIMFCSDPYNSFRSLSLPAGSYYTIEEILPNNTGAGLYDRLKLKNTQTGEYVTTGDISPCYNRQFVVVGHYEKLKQLYIGKQFIYVGEKGLSDYYDKADHMINVTDGKTNNDINIGTIWKCVDVQVKPRKGDDGMYLDKRSPVVLVFENQTYGKYYCYYEGNQGYPIENYDEEKLPLICGHFNDKSASEQLHRQKVASAKARRTNMIKKYGDNIGNLIADGKIKIGMTKNMCRDAWGAPLEINTTTLSSGTHEQWVYGVGSYVYFDGETITAIQN